jgi:Flp pilus assembly pilin Flp
MTRVLTTLAALRRRTEGQDLIEYALLAALVAIVATAGIRSVGTAVESVLWQTIAQNF